MRLPVSVISRTGAILNPWVKLAGQTTYSQGTAEVLVSLDGTFEWGRKSGKKAYVYVQTPDGSVGSNAVSIVRYRRLSSCHPVCRCLATIEAELTG